MPAPAIDAVVVAYNGRDTLRHCVEPLTALDGVHVIVVDNKSPEDPIPSVEDLPITIVRSPVNGGFSAGCNLGAAHGSAPMILFVNPDARMAPDALHALRGRLDAEPRTGVVGPRMEDENGSLLYTQRRFPAPARTFAQALFLHRLAPHASWSDELIRDADAYDAAGDPDWLSGACLLVRREAFDAIDGWDDGFFLYCEDTDLCRRLRRAGWDCRYEPAALVRHDEGGSAPRSGLLAIHTQSRLRYARKHLGRAATLDRAGVALNAATHALSGAHRPDARTGHAQALRAALARGGR
jgi:N-acetylglucosaminyl-diphospho-decaprenol L-rhamnosyltransferase